MALTKVSAALITIVPLPGDNNASDYQILFTSNGSPSANPNFTWNNASQLLTVTGTATISTSAVIPIVNGGTAVSSTLTLQSTSGAGTSDAIIFKTGSQSEKMRILTGGNVGIGTASPGGKLDVVGGRSFFAAASEPYAVGARYISTGGAVYFGATNGTATPDAQISAAGGGALMTLLNGGNVGIGTASPGTKLEVFGSITARAATTQDSVILAGRAGGTSSYGVTLTPTTLTASRTVTLADGNTTLATGTMAVAGGTLAQFAATTSAQLAGVISDETGSGALVFATSPSIATASLSNAILTGTLTAGGGVGTNGQFLQTTATGVQWANATSGTMAVTSGTLAQFAATTSAQLAGVISDETGTGALVFGTSPTITTSAVIPLVVGGTAVSSTLTLQSTSGAGSSDAIIFKTASQSERMRILTGGNVGIGTASPAVKFQVAGASSSAIIRINSTDTSPADLQFTTTQGSAGIGMGIYSGTGFTNNLQFNAAGFHFITGNVGIGVASPNNPLDIVSTSNLRVIRAGGAISDVGIRLDNTTAGGRGYTVFSSGTGSSIGVGNLNVYDETAGLTRLSINSGGNVGIGTTNPYTRLQVNQDVSNTDGTGVDQGQLMLSDASLDSSGLILGYRYHSGVTEYARIQARNSGGATNIAMQAGGGNVGIGTASPGYKLDVVGSLNVSGFIYGNSKEIFNTADSYLRLNQINTFSSGIWTGNSNIMNGSGYLAIGSNGGTTNSSTYIVGLYTGTNLIKIDSSSGSATSYFIAGNVGIGTASPGVKLDVTGATRIMYNIATPANYYNGLQLEIQAVAGTAGIGFHRTGNSHCGIYIDSYDQLKFNMNSGTVTLNGNTGTIWGSGNDGAGSGLDADLLDGLTIHTGTNNEGNKIVRTDASGYIQAGWISTISGAIAVTTNIDRIYCSNDSYLRYKTVADFQQQVGLTYKYSTPRSSITADSNYWTGVMGWGATNFDSQFDWGSGFFDNWSSPTNQPTSGAGHWNGLQVAHYTNGGTRHGFQMAVGSGDPSQHFIRGVWGGGFGTWRRIWNDGNDGAGSGLDADLLDGYNTATAATGNTIVLRDASGDFSARFVNASYFNSTDEVSAGTLTYLMGKFGNDYFRSATAAKVAAFISGQSFNTTGTATYSNYQAATGTANDWVGSFQATPAHTTSFREMSGGGPSGTWWFMENMRHSNGGGYWGRQNAWGWEDNANEYYSRNIQSNTFGAWVRFLHSGNFISYASAVSPNFLSLGVGTAASGTSGEIRATNNITAYYSDRRLKENIQTIDSALNKISKISGVTFTQNNLAETYGYSDYSRQVGVIAQEILEVLPEAVTAAPFDIAEDGSSKSGENYLTVRYEKIIPLLIEGIKELRSQIEELRNGSTK